MSFFFFKKKTQRIERIEPFLEITQRIELFFCWKYDSKNWTFFLNLTQRIAPTFLFHDSNTWTFYTWLKELNLLIYVTQILELFWKFLIQRNGPFFFRTQSFSSIKNNSQNWFFFESDPQNWFFLWIEPFNFLNMTQRIEPFNFWIWRKELNRLIFECDAKNWTV